ncbi:MAG: Mur ligase family protein [Polyangiaceae bacterium]
MRIHFVAVAGTGMGSVAGLFQSLGHDVSGSDTAFYPPMGPALRRWGIRLLEGCDPKHLEPRPDLVVIGNVCRPWNAEARAAIDGGIPYASMCQALADHVLPAYAPLVVGGTHGKTTTSAMTAHLLREAGRDPGWLIGGIPKNFDESFHASARAVVTKPRKGALPIADPKTGGRGVPFVIEGDEYDTAFFEKTPKFWHYRAEVGVITSIEYDHVDIYPTPEAYDRAFQGFVDRLPTHGLLIASASDPKIVALARTAACEVMFYALDSDDTSGAPPHFLACPAEVGADGQTFDLFVGGVSAGRVALRVPGLHNVRNALAAIAGATAYGVEVREAIAHLATFQGVARRQELLFTAGGVNVYDDFAHHPTAVRETLAALRAKHPKGALIAVFEPRSATACRAVHQAEYEACFGAADRVLFPPLGRSDIPEAERLDLDRIVAAIDRHGGRATREPSVDAIVETITVEAKPGDTVAVLSNGAFGGIYEKLRAKLGGEKRSGGAPHEQRPV